MKNEKNKYWKNILKDTVVYKKSISKLLTLNNAKKKHFAVKKVKKKIYSKEGEKSFYSKYMYVKNLLQERKVKNKKNKK